MYLIFGHSDFQRTEPLCQARLEKEIQRRESLVLSNINADQRDEIAKALAAKTEELTNITTQIRDESSLQIIAKLRHEIALAETEAKTYHENLRAMTQQADVRAKIDSRRSDAERRVKEQNHLYEIAFLSPLKQ